MAVSHNGIIGPINNVALCHAWLVLATGVDNEAFYPQWDRDLPSTPSDNLRKLIYLATEALTESFECIGAI